MQVLYLLFFLSGSAGLIYQVVWSRLFNQVFGVSVYAVATVLATYLGGLALGSFVLGKAADRSRNPIRFYALLEIGIGLTGLLGVYLTGILEPLHIAAANHFPSNSALLVIVRVLLAALVILPPTFLMGGTLPVITRGLVSGIGGLGRRLSFLYALNTLGAVVGSLCAGFVLIRSIGLHPTLWAAATINLAVGGTAWIIAKTQPLGLPAASEKRPERLHIPAAGIGLLIVMALSGFVSLSLEVLWTRLLVLIVGSSTYAFVTMLVSFLIGITLGSFLARLFVDRAKSLPSVFGWIQIGIGAGTLAALPIFRHVNFGEAQYRLDTYAGGSLNLLAIRFGISVLLMLVPTTLIGMTFPIAGKLYAREIDKVGGQIGTVYGANVAGNILGSVASAFIILPVLGLQKGIASLALFSLACAAWALRPWRIARSYRWNDLARHAPLALLALAVVLLLAHPTVPFAMMGEARGDPVLYYKEGNAGTVKVLQRAQDASRRLMAVDGVKIGESGGGVDQKQEALAHFPFLIATHPLRRVLSIGLGSGILIGEVAKHPEVERADCVELSASVIEGSRAFDSMNDRMAENPRVRVIHDDGAIFLRRTRDIYDAVISDGKSRTTHAGNSLFYSWDYYHFCSEHMDPAGIMIQWMPLDLAPRELRTVARTFLAVFPYSYLWWGPPESSFLVGSKQPISLDFAHIDRLIGDPSFADLRRYGWADAYDLAGMFVADRSAMGPWLAGEKTINTLERPVLEFYSLRDYAISSDLRQAENLTAIAAMDGSPSFSITLIGADLTRVRKYSQAAGDLARCFSSMARQGGATANSQFSCVESAMRAAPDMAILRWAAADKYFNLGLSAQGAGQAEVATSSYRRAVDLNPLHYEACSNLGVVLASTGRMDEAARWFTEAIRLNPGLQPAHTSLGQVLISQGKIADACEQFRMAAQIAPLLPEAQTDLGAGLVLTGRVEEGFGHFEEAARLSPRWATPWNAMAWIRAAHPDPRAADGDRAIFLAKRALRIGAGKDPVILDTLGAAYARAGRFEEAIATAEQARQAASSAANQRLAQMIGRRIEIYRKRSAYKETDAGPMFERLTAPFPMN